MKPKIIGTLASMLGWTTIAGGATWIHSMWRQVSPFRARQGCQETFAAAVHRVGADEHSLAATRRNFAFAATLHGLATVAGCGFAASAFLHGGNGFAWLGFAAVNGALAFTFAFRHWQTVENCFVLASDRMTDREWGYVALSRSKGATALYATESQRETLADNLSRSRMKGTSLDYEVVDKAAWRGEMGRNERRVAEREQEREIE